MNKERRFNGHLLSFFLHSWARLLILNSIDWLISQCHWISKLTECGFLLPYRSLFSYCQLPWGKSGRLMCMYCRPHWTIRKTPTCVQKTTYRCSDNNRIREIILAFSQEHTYANIITVLCIFIFLLYTSISKALTLKKYMYILA